MLADQAPSQICVAYPTFALQSTSSGTQILSEVMAMDVASSSGTNLTDSSQTSVHNNKQLNVLQQQQDTQDSQLVEVDVVGADGGTTELNASFGSLPTSQFTIGTTDSLNASTKAQSTVTVSSTDQPPSLVQPTVVAVNHATGGGSKNVSNHSLIDVTKGETILSMLRTSALSVQG